MSGTLLETGRFCSGPCPVPTSSPAEGSRVQSLLGRQAARVISVTCSRFPSKYTLVTLTAASPCTESLHTWQPMQMLPLLPGKHSLLPSPLSSYRPSDAGPTSGPHLLPRESSAPPSPLPQLLGEVSGAVQHSVHTRHPHMPVAHAAHTCHLRTPS